MNKFFKFGATAIIAALAYPFSINATDKDDPEKDITLIKTDYILPHPLTPDMLAKCGTTIYTTESNAVVNAMGTILTKRGQKARSLAVSPTNTRYVYIYDDKDKTKGEAYLTTEVGADALIHKFKPKKYGSLVSALYTTDAQNLLLGRADSLIVRVEPYKFIPQDTIKVDICPNTIEISNNGYFLAVSDGHKVVVYNYEEKKPRQRWIFESKVTDIKFNNDATEFAVLTDDGLASIYDTRTFLIKDDRDDLGDGIALDYNFDGKWMAVAVSPDTIRVVNRLDPSKDMIIPVLAGDLTDIAFIPDSEGNTMLAFTGYQSLRLRRMWNLSPYYGKLVKERADAKMNEWLKMMPGETMEEYRARVNDESRKRQRALFEAEIASSLANDLLSMSTITLGKYDRANQVLQINFDNMPSIYLPVGEQDLGAFHNASELEFRNSKYGVMNDDNFELIYAEVYNKNNGKTYIFDNIERASLSYMEGDDNIVSIEVIQQQQMEELKLQELRRKVIDEAKLRQIISNHTNITVNSEIVPDYDANGKRILNYKLNFSYEVEPDFSVVEDFAPGKYHVEESGAATAMLDIVKRAFEGDLARYVVPGKKLLVNIQGSADAIPIRTSLAYDGAYGEFEEVPVKQNGQMKAVTVTKKDGMHTNEQLAFIRGVGVKDYLTKNIENLDKMNSDYRYTIDVAEGRGGEFRRITVEFTFVDVNI